VELHYISLLAHRYEWKNSCRGEWGEALSPCPAAVNKEQIVRKEGFKVGKKGYFFFTNLVSYVFTPFFLAGGWDIRNPILGTGFFCSTCVTARM